MQISNMSIRSVIFTALVIGLVLCKPSFCFDLLDSADISYEGAFNLPEGQNGTSFAYADNRIQFNPANNSLFIASACGVAEVGIPTLVNSSDITVLNTGTVMQKCVDFSGSLSGWDASWDSQGWVWGGFLLADNKLYGTIYGYYDADGQQSVSHYFLSSTNLSTSAKSGLYKVGNLNPGFYDGYMGPIPSEWQTALGGSYFTGNCCIAIISRSSYGPAAFAFNPADVGVQDPAPVTPLVYYDADGQLAYHDTQNRLFNLTSSVVGMVIPDNTRTALFVGSQGIGPYCYGTPEECNDPASEYKSPHAYPYIYQAWAYDLNDFAAVKSGAKTPQSIKPYAVWRLNLKYEADDGHQVYGAAWDPATRRIYIDVHGPNSIGEPLIYAVKVASHSTGIAGRTGERHSQGITLSVNPDSFNPRVAVSVAMDRPEAMSIRIYSANGCLVADLSSHVNHGRVSWDASNRAAGVYFVRVQAGKAVAEKRVTLVR